MVNLTQKTIDLAYNCGLLGLEFEFIQTPEIPVFEYDKEMGVYAVFEVSSIDGNGRVAVNVHFVGQRRHLKYLAKTLKFHLNETEFESKMAPNYVVPTIVKINNMPRPENCRI